jgi:hypothetical protein
VPLRGILHRRFIEKKEKRGDSHQKREWDLGMKIGVVIGILFLLIIVVVVSSGGSNQTGPTESTSQTPSQETIVQEPIKSNEFAIGDRVSIDDNVYVINSVFTTPTIGNEYYNKMSDGIFVVIGVSVENGGSAATMVSPERFHITDSQNRQYGWSSDSIYLGSMGFEPLPLLKELGPGLKTSGYVAFDIPTGDKGLVLEISETFSDKKYVNIGDVENI